MEPEQPAGLPFRFTDPRQERIYRRLRTYVGPGPAEFYRDACRLIAMPGGLATTTHLVAHLLREIESALRDVLETVADGFVEAVQEARKKNKVHEAEIRAVLRALGIAEDEAIAQAWLRLADEDYGLAGRAHRDRLDPPRAMDAQFHKLWSEMEAVLDGVLDRLEAVYAKVLESLDKELLSKGHPSRADIKRLANNFPNNLVVRNHFFDHLQSPDWLKGLRDDGFFKRPAQPLEDPEKGTVQLTAWPEARYLIGVAADHPETVLAIILEADATKNAGVHRDFLEIANKLPAELAARIVPSVEGWLTSDYGGSLLFDRIRDLVVRLAESGQGAAALTLARALLTLSVGKKESISLFGAHLAPRFERWFYKETLDRVGPVLIQAVASRWLETSADLLAGAVRDSLGADDQKGPEDGSFQWRPAIEDHGQNEPQDSVIDGLVVAVREASLSLVAKDPSVISAIVALLEARGFKVFQRLALHVLRSHPDADFSLIVERLTRRDYFLDVTLHHEYFNLARECFPRLPRESQAVILGWIDDGPDVERVKARLRKHSDRDPTEVEVDAEADEWRFRKLAPLKDGLTGVSKERYDALASRFQPQEHPDFLIYGSGAVYSGFPSPKTVDDMRHMSLPDLVAFLKTWEPPSGLLDASPEGLAQRLAELAKSELERFGNAAPQFKDLEPTYVRGILHGLQQVVKDGKAIPWAPLLDLCAWVVSQPRERIERKTVVREVDPDWGWARKTIARLLDDGLKPGDSQIPFDLRSKVWEVLRALTDDPEPTPEYESKYGGSNMDPSTLSINTVRGEAMHAAMRYGGWVDEAIKKRSGSTEAVKRGFDDMPELKEVLEKHLDAQVDPSPAIRAVYGQWFAALAYFDEQWAKENVSKIFPLEDSNRALWKAAWGPYVTFVQPRGNTFRLLGEQYRHAIERLGGAKERVALGEDPEKQLVEHLMQLYWSGRIPLNDGLLDLFYSRASLDLRSYAMEFVGRALSNTEGPVDPAILERMKQLWESRLSIARKSGDVGTFGPELAAFGWWFRSGKLDDEGAIEQLKHSLEFFGGSHRETYVVMERLAEIAPRMPRKAVEVAALIVAGDAEGWVPRLHREQLRKIITTARDSADDVGKQAAIDLANRLVARGQTDYRDLLSKS